MDRLDRYFYEALAADGTIVLGHMEAVSQNRVVATLRSAGLMPLKVTTETIERSFWLKEIGFSSRKKLNLKQCADASRELSTLLQAGITPHESVKLLSTASSDSRQLRSFFFATEQQLRLGKGFADAVEASEFHLPPDFLPIVRAGEVAGNLPEAFRLLSEQYRGADRVRQLIVNASLYPVFLLGVALLVFGIIAFFVAPSMTELFLSLGKPAPSVIGGLAAIAGFTTKNTAAVIIGVAVACIAIVPVYSMPKFGERLRDMAFSMPILRDMFVWPSCLRFASTLNLYLSTNIPLSKSVAPAVKASGLPSAEQIAEHMQERIRHGGSLSSAAREYLKLPPRILDLLEIGEKGGQLSATLRAISIDAKSRHEKAVGVLTALLAPALILVMGGVIGSIILGVFSALLEINEISG